jgi:hypothetical protein
MCNDKPEFEIGLIHGKEQEQAGSGPFARCLHTRFIVSDSSPTCYKINNAWRL